VNIENETFIFYIQIDLNLNFVNIDIKWPKNKFSLDIYLIIIFQCEDDDF